MSSETALVDVPWVIESKFAPNRPRLDLVRRERLLAQLHEGVSKKLALIVAPAGYGKSSLLGQWVAEAEERNIRYGWLTLESGEADAKQFLAYVVLVLAHAGAQMDDLVTGARDGFADAAVSSVLSKLVRTLNEADEQIVLVLEDYHNAECDAVNELVRHLIRDTLSKFTIFIDSRRLPRIDAFSLIASGDAIEIGAAQLRLTKAETLAVLQDVVDEHNGLEIYEQTEGWPVAVQLALVQKRARPLEPILTGVDGGLIASYLTEQVLSALGKETQELLLTVAFLERFNPELTNYVMDSSDAWSRIDSLASFAALIVPLDSKGGWYRLHHLFAEYLREMQMRRNQLRAKEILSRASEWYSERKQVVEAVRYAAMAEDYSECERLILEAGGWKIILHEGISVLRNALRLLPDDVIAKSARLMIARAYLHCKYGEIPEARAMLDASAQAVKPDDRELADTDRLVVESMINLYEDRLKWSDEYKRIRKYYNEEEYLDPLGQGTMRCEEVLIHMSRAEFEQAGLCVRDAFAKMRQSGSVLGLNYCYIHAAHIALYRGDLTTAAANVERAIKMADENFGSDSGLKAVASVLDYSLRTWRGECAADDLEPFKTVLFHTIDNDGWAEIYITGLNALIMLAQQCGDHQAPFDTFAKIRIFAEHRGLYRLERFCSFQELAHVTREREFLRHTKATTAGALRFADAYNFDHDPRNWQSYLLASTIPDVSESEQEKMQRLADAIALAEKVRAGLWRFSLKTTNIMRMSGNGHNDVAKQELLALLKAAIPSRLMGPFLSEESIVRLIGEIRSELRQNEEELITLQFIDGILERARVLRPSKASGILSEREYEILQKLADGLSNKEIARALELTENTVKFHLKSLFSKLAVNKRTQAVIEAQRRGLID